MVSGGGERDSVIHVRVSILPQTTLPSKLPRDLFHEMCSLFMPYPGGLVGRPMKYEKKENSQYKIDN